VDYTEVEAAGRPAMWLVPKRARTDRVLLCLHGGGFVGGSIYTHRKMFGHLAKAAGVRAPLVGYRLLPEGGGYPGPVDEGRAAYRWLLDQGTEPGHIAFAGDSVGGWLAITTLDVYPGMLHTFQMAAGRAPEADDAIGKLAAWVRPRLGL